MRPPTGGGILAYVPMEALVGESAVVIVEPDGRVAALPLPEKRYWYPRFSPDGRRLALDVGTGSGSDDEIWVHVFASGRFSRVSFIAGSAFAAWSRDGAWVAYTGGMLGRVNAVFRKRVEGGAEEERIWQANDVGSVSDWSPDGRALVVPDIRGELGLYHVPLDGGEARRLFAAPGLSGPLYKTRHEPPPADDADPAGAGASKPVVRAVTGQPEYQRAGAVAGSARQS